MNIRDDFILKEINEGYLVGGIIRDFLTGKTSVDRDIAISGAEEFAHKIADKFGGTFITLDSVNKIFRVVLPDKTNFLDISEIEGSTIEEDLKRRDFTINAIAYDLKNDKFIDTTGGINDLENKVLRHISDKNFEDDPLRLLRGFRFFSTTGFRMTEELESAISKYAHLILKPAPERINYELMKLFGGKYAAETLLKMNEFGILEALFPFVKEMKQVPPNTHHHLDLLHHVIETVRQIEIQYENLTCEVKEHLQKVDFGGFPRINHLKLAGFMHDIGKFSCWTIEENGRHRFIKHADIGAELAIPFLKKMKFSKKQIEYITCMIKNHIYPSNVIAAPDLNDKIMMRYIRKMEDNVIDNIILAKADRLSARGVDVTEEMIENNMRGLDRLLKFYLEKKDTLKPLPKLLDGKEIMELTGLKPTPQLGKIIEALKEAQLNGDVTNIEEAEVFIKNKANIGERL